MKSQKRANFEPGRQKEREIEGEREWEERQKQREWWKSREKLIMKLQILRRDLLISKK